MVVAVDENDDIGFDIKRARLALIAWLVRHGTVEPEVKELVSARRRLLRAPNRALSAQAAEAIDESIALAIMNAHDMRHADKAAAAPDAEARPLCTAARCKTHAVSCVFAKLHEYETERDGPRARVARALESLLDELMGRRHLHKIVGSMDAMLKRMQQVQDEIQKDPDHPRVIIGSSPASLSLPALTRSCLALSEIVGLEHQTPAVQALVQRERSEQRAYTTISADDVLFPFEHAVKILSISEHLGHAVDLSLEVLRDLAPTLPVRRARKRRGRPTYHPLLKWIRHRLQQGGFSSATIAGLIPDRPLETAAQREDAVQRVKHAIRAVRGSSHRSHNR